jgi:diaminopimelate epimerase
MKIPFWKLQSVGNDFPLVHVDDVRGALAFRNQERLAAVPETAPPQATKECSVTPDQALPGLAEVTPDAVTAFLSELSIAICDRRFGVGGDGLLAVEMEGEALRLRMFNPDGTEDFCGNGIRCAVVHAHALGWVGNAFTVRHLDREVPTEIGEGRVRTTLGLADYRPEKVPHGAYGELFNTTVWSGMDAGQPLSLFGSALTTGSTHVVIPTTSLPDDESFLAVSPKIETDPLYPDRTSVIWAQEVGPDHLKIRIWERGVGETLGCGTGATAAAADYLRRKGRGGKVTVESRGGTLQVSAASWMEPLTIEGIAEQVFRGEYRAA